MSSNTSWFQNHLAFVGIFLSVLAAVAPSIIGILKTRADKKSGSVAAGSFWSSYGWYVLAIFGFAAISVTGNLLAKHQGEKAAKAALDRLQQMGDKFRDLTVELDMARHEDSQALADSKMEALKERYVIWVHNFSANLPEEQPQYEELKRQLAIKNDEAKSASSRNEIRRSEESFIVFALATRSIQELVNSTASAAHKTNVHVTAFDLPQNLYTNNLQNSISWSTNSAWKLFIARGWSNETQYEKDYDPNQPYLRVEFHHNDKRSALMIFQVSQNHTKFRVRYQTTLPVPNPDVIEGEYNVSSAEDVLKLILPQVISAHVLEAESK